MLGRRLRRRLPALADQAASSISNIVVVVVVARSFDETSFGAFSLAMLGYSLVLMGVRSLVTEPYLSLYSAEPESVRRGVIGDVLGTVMALSLACSLVALAVSAVIGGISGAALLALGGVLPLVMFQDGWRYVFIIDRPVLSLAIDVLWLALLVPALALAPGDARVGWYVMAWGVTGGAAGLVGMMLAGGWAGVPRPRRWFDQHWSIGWRFFAQFLTAQGSSQVVTGSLGAIAGLSALGAVKASSTYFGPLHTLHGGIHYAVVPEGARSRNDPDRLWRMQRMVAGLLAVIAVLWTVAGLLLPDSWGRAAFGATWPGARDLMLPMGLGMVLGGGMSGAIVGLRSLADASRGLRSQLYVMPSQIALPLAGAAVGGATGFAWGFAASRLVALVIWWRLFRDALAEVRHSVAEVGPDHALRLTESMERAVEVWRQEVAV